MPLLYLPHQISVVGFQNGLQSKVCIYRPSYRWKGYQLNAVQRRFEGTGYLTLCAAKNHNGKMKYYEPEHRVGYAEIQRLGLSCWNELHGASSAEFSLQGFLDRVLPTLGLPDRPKALEFGCGTGMCCCYLAERGFEVLGMDIEPKAIELARKIAGDRGLDIDYAVGDICDKQDLPETNDLIVDGYCLQCIVFDDERQRIFASVGKALSKNGYYIIGTAVWNEDHDYDGTWVDSDQGIVYAPLKGNPEQYPVAKCINGSWHLPNRRHLTP